jgi:hypothetical protein
MSGVIVVPEWSERYAPGNYECDTYWQHGSPMFFFVSEEDAVAKRLELSNQIAEEFKQPRYGSAKRRVQVYKLTNGQEFALSIVENECAETPAIGEAVVHVPIPPPNRPIKPFPSVLQGQCAVGVQGFSR